jgi:hypothetical protein
VVNLEVVKKIVIKNFLVEIILANKFVMIRIVNSVS